MVHRVAWSPRAIEDLDAIAQYISADSNAYAATVVKEINFYGDFRSAQVTREHFESNATTDAATLIERGNKLDEQGRRIGERVVTVFKGSEAIRISWTEGDIFWSVQAPSLQLARKFEESEIVHSITMSNKRLHRIRRYLLSVSNSGEPLKRSVRQRDPLGHAHA